MHKTRKVLMATLGPRTAAGLGIVVSAAIGLVTGLVTDNRSPGLITGLIALVVLGVFLAVRTGNGTGGAGSRRTRGRLTARRGGLIASSGHTLSGGAKITTVADSGTVMNSPINSTSADYTMTASAGGEIRDSPADLHP